MVLMDLWWENFAKAKGIVVLAAQTLSLLPVRWFLPLPTSPRTLVRSMVPGTPIRVGPKGPLMFPVDGRTVGPKSRGMIALLIGSLIGWTIGVAPRITCLLLITPLIGLVVTGRQVGGGKVRPFEDVDR